MTLNELRDKAYKNGVEKGFHEKPCDLATTLMLIVSELSEAMEADRNGRWVSNVIATYDDVSKKCLIAPRDIEPEIISTRQYENLIKGRVEEEIADAFIRLFDLAGIYNIDLDWHVVAKMAYNEKRSYKHGKKY